MVSAIRSFLLASLFLSSMGIAFAQQPAVTPPCGVASSGTKDSFPIIIGDKVTVKILDAPELEQDNLRVTDAGDIPLLLLGPVKICDLTPEGASREIAKAYTNHN